ncbi:unnamed protein product [Nesidiocoris tenuis]|uniref:Uncharacterized protein n=1 Tax=Nesidiocoris tenuis TaxID=355587 RepID=A0A6H5HHN7_9HEMI|nr:unnamed protein product [Nesidiocoris tenuis]CAB0016489.1 unnamed protein product [Nesidiocoris tenuis]
MFETDTYWNSIRNSYVRNNTSTPKPQLRRENATKKRTILSSANLRSGSNRAPSRQDYRGSLFIYGQMVSPRGSIIGPDTIYGRIIPFIFRACKREHHDL